MNKYNMNVLVEAKKEYTKQLISILTPQIYIGIQSIYRAAQKYCQESGDKNIWSKFQYLLARTPSWNQEKLDTEFKRIVNVTECDYIEDLLTAVFVSHTKVYSSIRLKKKSKTIELNVNPETEPAFATAELMKSFNSKVKAKSATTSD